MKISASEIRKSWFTLERAAKELGVSTQYVRQLCINSKLTAVKIRPSLSVTSERFFVWYILPESLKAYAETARRRRHSGIRYIIYIPEEKFDTIAAFVREQGCELVKPVTPKKEEDRAEHFEDIDYEIEL